jgi:hypothetical protein
MEIMFICRLNKAVAVVIVLGICTFACSAQKMNVKIIQRQNNETGYSNFIPGHSSSSSNTNVNCYGDSTNVNCSGTTTTNGYSTAPKEVSYSVTGATFSLLLPDGRVAVVNCVSKYSPRGDYVNRRGCRMPLVDEIQVEFKGKNAKLIWPVSLDGKKLESETYKILAVNDK